MVNNMLIALNTDYIHSCVYTTLKSYRFTREAQSPSLFNISGDAAMIIGL